MRRIHDWLWIGLLAAICCATWTVAQLRHEDSMQRNDTFISE